MEAKKQLPKKYRMGFENWDNQHAEIIEILRSAHETIKLEEPDKRKRMRETLFRIKKYYLIHFKYEESKMTKLNYPDLLAHQEEHGKFIGMVEDHLRTRKYSEEKFLSAIQFLQEWFMEHIYVVDKRFADFVRLNKKERLL